MIESGDKNEAGDRWGACHESSEWLTNEQREGLI